VNAVLERWFAGQLSADVRAWFEAALSDVRGQGPGGDLFAARWSGCGRRLGRTTVPLTPAEGTPLASAGAPFAPVGWGMDEVGRSLLLLAAMTMTGDGRPPEADRGVVVQLYRRGEMREQQAIVRTLAWLPGPAAFAELASEAVRGNVVPVLEALACDNPFPAAHMSALGFNQMIMKAIFNGLPLARVLGLADRNTPELRRMVEAFASERRAAGRPVPADLGLIAGG
jgi:hypothetical protein